MRDYQCATCGETRGLRCAQCETNNNAERLSPQALASLRAAGGRACWVPDPSRVSCGGGWWPDYSVPRGCGLCGFTGYTLGRTKRDGAMLCVRCAVIEGKADSERRRRDRRAARSAEHLPFSPGGVVSWTCPPDCACPTSTGPSGQVRVLCSALARAAS